MALGDFLARPGVSPALMNLGAGLLSQPDLVSGLGAGMHGAFQSFEAQRLKDIENKRFLEELGLKKDKLALDRQEFGLRQAEAPGLRAYREAQVDSLKAALDGEWTMKDGLLVNDRTGDVKQLNPEQQKFALEYSKQLAIAGRAPAHRQNTHTYVDEVSGLTYNQTYDPNTNQYTTVPVKGPDGQPLTRADLSAMDARNAAIGKAQGEGIASAADLAVAGYDKLQSIGRLRQFQAGAAPGPQVYKVGQRILAEYLGVEIGANAADIQSFKREIAENRIDLRKELMGQGQITEKEADQVYQAFVNIDTDPRALDTAFDILEKGAKRDITDFEEWTTLDQETQSRKYGNNYKLYRLRKRQEEDRILKEGSNTPPSKWRDLSAIDFLMVDTNKLSDEERKLYDAEMGRRGY